MPPGRLDLLRLLGQDDKWGKYLRQLYQGAICLLFGPAVEGRITFVSHAVREIADKLVKTKVAEFQPTGELRELLGIWERTRSCEQISQKLDELSERMKGKRTSQKRASHLFEKSIDPRTVTASRREALAERWFAIREYFTAIAHGRAPQSVEEFMSRFEEFELAARVLLSYAEDAELDKFLGMERPADVDRLMEIIKDESRLRYFLHNLRIVEWLDVFIDRGLFATPPEPKPTENGGTAYPYWALSRLLIRYAADHPETVLRAISRIGYTKNVQVVGDILEAGINMPVESGVTLVPLAIQWSEDADLLILGIPSTLARFAEGLAPANSSEALHIIGSLLALNGLQGETPGYSEPRSRINEQRYEEICIRFVPRIAKADPTRTIGTLAAVLEKATSADDESSFWRPAVEDHKQNIDREPRSHLVTAIRETAEIQLAARPSSINEVLQVFERRKGNIFLRLQLHVLGLHTEGNTAVTGRLLTDRNLFLNRDLSHEYYHLLRASFGKLCERQQRCILEWIDAGPDRNELRSISEEDFLSYKESWQARWLSAISNDLPEPWRALYERTKNKVPPHPDFRFYAEARWEEKDEWPVERLKQLSVGELVATLKSQAERQNRHRFDVESLGQRLSHVVESDPEKYVAEANLFAELREPIISGFFDGLFSASRQKKHFEWRAVLTLIESVLHRTPCRGERYANWTAQSIVRLLEECFEEDKNTLPFDLRSQVWDLVKRLTDHPNPSEKHEAEFGGDNMDPATLSVNTVRGNAMHAVIRYALWCHRNMKSLPDGQSRAVRGFDEMPEVAEVLNRHLDQAIDPSAAVRAVYGQWFPQLVALDRHWAKEHAGVIFDPKAPRALGEAAWTTYMAFGGAYGEVFELLRDRYRWAVNNLRNEPRQKRPERDPERNLSEHVMVFYWQGKLELDDDIMGTFYRNVSDATATHALWFVGRALSNTEEAVPGEILERLKMLWERRRTVARSGPAGHAGEMGAFGGWFESGKFDDAWSILELRTALELAKGKTADEYRVMERLVKLAPRFPAEAAECLGLFVQNDKDGWFLAGTERENQATVILKAALGSEDHRTHEIGVDVVNIVGRAGHYKFGELLKPGQGGE